MATTIEKPGIFVARHHLLSAIAAAPLEVSPWKHCVVSNAFPPDFYRQIQLNLPAPVEMEALSVKTTKRFVYWLKHGKSPVRKDISEFWQEFVAYLFDDLWLALEDKLGVAVGSSVGSEITHDVPGYALGPHTDTPDKLITALFYLPISDVAEQHGTVLYHCATPDPMGKGHKLTNEYQERKRIPFLPNTLFFFQRTDVSFHGVHTTPLPRWALAFDVFK